MQGREYTRARTRSRNTHAQMHTQNARTGTRKDGGLSRVEGGTTHSLGHWHVCVPRDMQHTCLHTQSTHACTHTCTTHSGTHEHTSVHIHTCMCMKLVHTCMHAHLHIHNTC